MARASNICGAIGCPNLCAGYFCLDHAEPDPELVEAVERLLRDGSESQRAHMLKLATPLVSGPDEAAELRQ